MGFFFFFFCNNTTNVVKYFRIFLPTLNFWNLYISFKHLEYVHTYVRTCKIFTHV